MPRRLTTILAADVAGYSRLVGKDEEQVLSSLRRHRAELVDPLIDYFGGRIANTAGDSLLVEYASAVEAIRCAVAIQEGMADRNGATPQDRRIEFRIGVNVGDVVADEGDGDLLGDDVNIAARLEGLAPAGGILVSRTTRDHVRDKIDEEFEDLGEIRVKNIARPVRTFRVLKDGETASDRPAAGSGGRGRMLASGAALGLAAIAGYWAGKVF